MTSLLVIMLCCVAFFSQIISTTTAESLETHFNTYHSNIHTFQYQPITTLQTSNITYNKQYYNEITSSSSSTTTITNPSPSTPPPTTTTTQSSQAKVQQIASLSVTYSNYHPTDQLWSCYYLAHHITNTPLNITKQNTYIPFNPDDVNKSYNTNHLQFQDFPKLTLKNNLLQTFLSCCPTIYTPTTTNINNNNPFIQTSTLTLQYPFLDVINTHKVGCGHAHYTIPINSNNNITTGKQNDEYPRKIDKFLYRNTPNGWYYNPSGHVSTQNNVITYSTFQLPYNNNDNDNNQTLDKYNHNKIEYFKLDNSSSNSGNNSSDKKTDIWDSESNFGQLSRLSCPNRSFMQSGEGYHRTLRYDVDLSTCVENNSNHKSSIINNKNNDNNNNDDNNGKKLNQQSTQGLECKYLLSLNLPNSLFIDPYQISYTTLASYYQYQRDLESEQFIKEMGIMITKEDDVDGQNNNNTIITPHNIEWFLYDFIDVEAQLNNASGNNIALLFNMEDDQSKLTRFEIPLHLRYASSQITLNHDENNNNNNDNNNTHQTSSIDDIMTLLQNIYTNALSTTNNYESRFTSFLLEPHLFKYCYISNHHNNNITHNNQQQQQQQLQQQQSILPSIPTLISQIIQNDSTQLQLKPISLTVPVGMIHLYPFAFLITFSTLFICGLALLHVTLKHQKT